MDWSAVAPIITALIGTGGLGAVVKLVIEYGRKLEREEQASQTLAAKDEEIAELEEENARLWRLLDGVTRPPGRSS